MANIPTRSNNPGDIRGAGGGFTVNATPLDGQAALYNDLTAKMTGKSKTGLNGDSTLYEFVQKYAPKGDGNNDPVSYVADIANKMGVSPDTKIGTLMPHIDQFARAVAEHEGYKGPWSGSTDTKISNFNPAPYSGGAVGGNTTDSLNIPGLTVDQPDTSHTGTVGKVNLQNGKVLVPDAISPDADQQANDNNYKNVSNPIIRAGRQTAHEVGQNALGVGKSLLNTGLGAAGLVGGAFSPDGGAGLKGLISKIPKNITQPTNHAQSAGNIGGILGQLLAPVDQVAQASGKTGLMEKLVNKVPGVKTIKGLAGLDVPEVASGVASKAKTAIKTGLALYGALKTAESLVKKPSLKGMLGALMEHL